MEPRVDGIQRGGIVGKIGRGDHCGVERWLAEELVVRWVRANAQGLLRPLRGLGRRIGDAGDLDAGHRTEGSRVELSTRARANNSDPQHAAHTLLLEGLPIPLAVGYLPERLALLLT